MGDILKNTHVLGHQDRYNEIADLTEPELLVICICMGRLVSEFLEKPTEDIVP